ncbi:guanylate kinase [Carpediemonas membranifera]|uniref:Guanylate kinase n=1 Tax=Carpediemonas membranifera TaxID=201153 RepID=A0A8J6ATH6_9EUKA|nr:guanylate kinase [Carpediemonas membranifera]KAG9394186.1 guanylate kinase [Carpediemonas membranifera]|eukprot:KAG9394182.1 guanylate kinase [Carpediemonas membranifera]
MVSETEQATIRRPVVLNGPSGVGKSTIIKQLMRKYPGEFVFAVSHTSRPMRAGEEDGKDYHFKTREEIEDLRARGLMLETAEVHDNIYGTSVQAVESELGTSVCILDVDYQGALSCKRYYSDKPVRPLYIFVGPSDLDPETVCQTIEKRLRLRGTESEETIQKRLTTAGRELEFFHSNPGFYDHVIINKDGALDETVAKVEEIFMQETVLLASPVQA